MPLSFLPMSEEYAREIVAWRYPAEYELYNADANDVSEDVRALTNPANAYYAVWDDEYGLFGFCCFGRDARVPGGDYAADALDVGLGMRPDLAGRGKGTTFLQAILAFAQEEMAAEGFRATIASSNTRSRRLFERAGFTLVQTFTSTGLHAIEFRRYGQGVTWAITYGMLTTLRFRPCPGFPTRPVLSAAAGVPSGVVPGMGVHVGVASTGGRGVSTGGVTGNVGVISTVGVTSTVGVGVSDDSAVGSRVAVCAGVADGSGVAAGVSGGGSVGASVSVGSGRGVNTTPRNVSPS